MDCLFKDINDLVYLGEIIKERFQGKDPARKAYKTRLIRDEISFQVDSIVFRRSQLNKI